MREAKEQWFLCKVVEAERGHSGKILWRCIKGIQRGRRGLIPVRSSMVKDEEGNVCSTSDKQQERWRKHLAKILSIQSEFSMDNMSRMRQRPIRPEMEDTICNRAL